MLPSNAAATVITFDEATSFEATFNGLSGSVLLSSDGEYLVESFYTNFSGHFHITDCGFDGDCEENHNQQGDPIADGELQGIRISRVDGGLFDLVSMNIFEGEASIGDLTNFTTGAGIWTLFASPGVAPIIFGLSFTGLDDIFIADPFAAGGTSMTNLWDNITLEASVPEPGLLLLLGVGSLGAILNARRRQRAARP
jgi:hypothetical protein